MMEFLATDKIILTGNALIIPIDSRETALVLLEEQEQAKYPYKVEVAQNRPKRSLNANNYFWRLCTMLAEKMNTSNDELYLILLKRYSEPEYLQIVKEAFEKISRLFRHSEIKEETATSIKMFGWIGSSSFDSKEMYRLIEGTISECKLQGIQTKTDEEITSLCESWGNDE